MRKTLSDILERHFGPFDDDQLSLSVRAEIYNHVRTRLADGILYVRRRFTRGITGHPRGISGVTWLGTLTA